MMSFELSLLVLVFDVVFVVVAVAALDLFCANTLACFGAQFYVTRFTF